MNNPIANFSNKFLVSFVIVALVFQSMSPAIGVTTAQASAPAQEATTNPALSFDEGMTLGSEIAPEERAPDSPVPDFGEQVAAQAKAQPAEAVPLRLKAFAVPAIYIPGKPLQITWTIDGLSTLPAVAGQALPSATESGPQLSIQAPLGVTPNDPTLKAAMNAQGLLNIPDNDLAPLQGAGGQAEPTVDARFDGPNHVFSPGAQLLDGDGMLHGSDLHEAVRRIEGPPHSRLECGAEPGAEPDAPPLRAGRAEKDQPSQAVSV